MSSSSSSCSEIDITIFLIAMISLTISLDFLARRFGVKTRKLRQIDRFDQRPEYVPLVS